MMSGIIGGTVYAYKHKDYGDVFLYLCNTMKLKYFKTTDKSYEAINNYHSNLEKFEEMLEDLQEDYVYAKSFKNYEDGEGYSGTLEKTTPLQIKDFVKVSFVSNYNEIQE